MPQVKIRYEEAEGNLPDVCLRCGKRAVCRVTKTIRLHDTATGYGRGVLAVMRLVLDYHRHFSSPTLALRGPFCAAHRDHWALRRTLIWVVIGLMPLLLLFILALYLLHAIGGGIAGLLCFLTLFAGILSAAFIYGTSTIKLSCNDKTQTLVLAHVHPKFIQALEQQRQQKDRRQPVQRRDASSAAVQAIPIVHPPGAPAREGPAAFAGLADARDERPAVRRVRRGNPNHLAIVLVTAIGVPLILLVVVAMLVKIVQVAERVVNRPPAEPAEVRANENQDPPDRDRDVEPGTVVPGAPPLPPQPAALAGQPSIDLIPLANPRKDVVHGRWLVAGKVLHCNDGSFVPRMQFPYRPPAEYDFIVTFWQPGLRNGISLVMPNPNGGSFFWFLGSEEGQGYGFHGRAGKEGRKPGLIKEKTIHTTVVQVRKGSVRALVDGQELIRLNTNFRDLECDDWRRIHNTGFLAVACDDPTVFYYVRVAEVSGKGQKGR
jgi:hypothetical protein